MRTVAGDKSRASFSDEKAPRMRSAADASGLARVPSPPEDRKRMRTAVLLPTPFRVSWKLWSRPRVLLSSAPRPALKGTRF